MNQPNTTDGLPRTIEQLVFKLAPTLSTRYLALMATGTTQPRTASVLVYQDQDAEDVVIGVAHITTEAISIGTGRAGQGTRVAATWPQIAAVLRSHVSPVHIPALHEAHRRWLALDEDYREAKNAREKARSGREAQIAAEHLQQAAIPLVVFVAETIQPLILRALGTT